jgi:tetratricopeptide (TPR) repeat protein
MRYFISAILLLLSLVGCRSDGNTDQPETKTRASEKQPQEQNKAPEKQVLHPLDSLTLQIQQEGPSTDLLLARARLYLAYQNINAGKQDIAQATALDSSLAEIHELQGEVHYMLNQTRQAKDEWEECLSIDPENSICLMRLAELLIAAQNYDRALKLVNRQLEIDNSDAQAYFAKGIIVRDRYQDTALALQYFQNAIDLDQDYYEAIDMMAVTLTAKGDTLARFYYDRMLEMRPNDASTYYKLGVYYMNQGEINRALESYSKAIQINPRDAESYYNMAYMHVELKQYSQAREYFTKAIQFQDRNYKGYYGRGFTFEVVGDIANARKDYQKALEILPVYKPAGEALARLNREYPQ